MTDKLRAVEPEAGPRPSKRKRRNSIFFYAYGQFRKDYPEYAETPFEDLNPAARNEVNSRMKELRKAKKALDAANKRGENKRPAIPCPEQTSNFPLPAETAASSPERAPDYEQEYHRVMSLLRNTKRPHGLCEPRDRKACTNCNAQDELDRLLGEYKGARIITSREAATPSPDTCPHKMLKRQNVGNQHWYRCPECQQKFIASDWDGKVEAGAPSPVVPNSAGVSPVSAKVERTGAEVLIRPQERGISADEAPDFAEPSFGKLVQEIIELKAEIKRLKDALFEANRRNDG